MNTLIKKNYKFFLLFLLLTGYSIQLHAADNSNDSITAIFKKRADKAALMSAVLPGSGQVYNKKYWKVPLIYGGGAALIYFANINSKEYRKYKEAIVFRNDNDSSTVDNYPRYTNEDLTVRKNYYRRNRDLCYIFTGLLYTLNILDAYVDSQLMNFDISDDLSIHTGGTFNYNQYGSPMISFQLILSLK